MHARSLTPAFALVAGILAGCGAETKPVDFSAVEGFRVGMYIRNRLSDRDFMPMGRELRVFTDFHGDNDDECILDKNVVATLNGVPLHRGDDGGPLIHVGVAPGMGRVVGCSGPSFSTANSALVAPPPAGSSEEARTGVLVITDGKRTVRMEVPSLLDDRTYTVTGPDDSVLVPGTQAVLAWSNQSGLVDVQPGTYPLGITLVNGWSDVEHRALSPAVHLKAEEMVVSENRVEFTVPQLANGKGYVLLDTSIPLKASVCEGADSCSASVEIYSAAKEFAVESK
jgi:hypothetical protein